MQYLHNSNDSEWKKNTTVLIKVVYYSSRFVKDTNAFWYFCAGMVYMLFPWEVFINKYTKKFCNIFSFNDNITHFQEG